MTATMEPEGMAPALPGTRPKTPLIPFFWRQPLCATLAVVSARERQTVV